MKIIFLIFFIFFTTGINNSHAEGFNTNLFETWLEMRAGDDSNQVFWYSEGSLKTFPEGKPIADMIGFDVSRIIRDTEYSNKAKQLSRKIFYFFDSETGERLSRPPIAYEYQVKDYVLEGDEIIYSVESRYGDRISYVRPTRNYNVKEIDNTIWFNYSVFINRGTGKFENSDFYIIKNDNLSDLQKYQHSWVSYGVGPVMSRAVAWRYNDFSDLPDKIQSLVSDEAPLWMNAPESISEIITLRDQVPIK